MKGKTAGIVAASALALLGACATPQEHPSPSNASPHTGGLSRDNSYASEMADIAWRETDPEELKRWLDDPLRLPGPAAGLPTEPAAPVIAASRLRADLLRLIGSIKKHEDSDRPNVEIIMGMQMGKPEGTDLWFYYWGSVNEGWTYGVEVMPRKGRHGSDIRVSLDTKRSTDTKTQQCTYDFSRFTEDMQAIGYVRKRLPLPPPGSGHFWTFSRGTQGTDVGVGVIVDIYRADEARPRERFCLREISITPDIGP